MAGVKGRSGRTAQQRLFKKAITDLVLEPVKKGSPRTRMDNIAEQLISKAEQGDMTAIREVLDRVDGKAVQAVDLDATVDTPDPLQQLLEDIAKNGKRIGQPSDMRSGDVQ